MCPICKEGRRSQAAGVVTYVKVWEQALTLRIRCRRRIRDRGTGMTRRDPERIASLSSMLEPQRLKRIDEVVSKRTRNVTVLMEGVDKRHNQGAVLRTCEAFGIQNVHVTRTRGRFRPARQVTQGCEKWLTLTQHDDPLAAVSHLRENGYSLLASRLDAESVPLHQLDLTGRVALVFGNEQFGVLPEVAAACDHSFRIPMAGFSQSFNISVAAAITLYEVSRQRMLSLEEPGDLPAEEREELEQRYLELSVLDKATELVDLRGWKREKP